MSGTRLVTADEFAAMLRVSRKAVYQLAAGRQIPCVRLGRSVRFRLEDVEAFVEDHLVPARPELTVTPKRVLTRSARLAADEERSA